MSKALTWIIRIAAWQPCRGATLPSAVILNNDLFRSAGVSRVEEYDAIDDNDIQVIGQSETFRISDPDDSKRIYLALLGNSITHD